MAAQLFRHDLAAGARHHGASHRGGVFLSRRGASANFSALNYWFTRYQTITDAWSLKIAGARQTASGPLFLSQQFYLGGLAFGRGYPVLGLEDGCCHWPLGNPGTADFRFCGDKAVPQRPYCAHHLRIGRQ